MLEQSKLRVSGLLSVGTGFPVTSLAWSGGSVRAKMLLLTGDFGRGGRLRPPKVVAAVGEMVGRWVLLVAVGV